MAKSPYRSPRAATRPIERNVDFGDVAAAVKLAIHNYGTPLAPSVGHGPGVVSPATEGVQIPTRHRIRGGVFSPLKNTKFLH